MKYFKDFLGIHLGIYDQKNKHSFLIMSVIEAREKTKQGYQSLKIDKIPAKDK